MLENNVSRTMWAIVALLFSIALIAGYFKGLPVLIHMFGNKVVEQETVDVPPADYGEVAYEYYLDGGSPEYPAGKIKKGTDLVLEDEPTKPGYQFLGWRIQGNLYSPGSVVKNTSDSYYIDAIWKKINPEIQPTIDIAYELAYKRFIFHGLPEGYNVVIVDAQNYQNIGNFTSGNLVAKSDTRFYTSVDIGDKLINSRAEIITIMVTGDAGIIAEKTMLNPS